MTKFKIFLGQWLASLTRKLQNNFYLYLAVFFSVLVLLDAGAFHIGENMRDKAFDLMVKYRIFQPKPDQSIVIVDVNEASLAAMAGEYGRWPWPRQVFAEFVENIEAQKPQAIVFDILFSDADVYNPDSDAYFNEVIAATDNTYFPILRLPEDQDGLSQLKLKMIPGLEAAPGLTPNPDSTVAMVLPHFDAALNSKRMGTHNIEPDKDGIAREYKLWRDVGGWRIPALPLAVGTPVKAHQKALPQNMLINWRGKPFTYQYVNFSDVMTDLGSKVKKRPPNEFAGKIVIIGSTAPSLFDLKATPMAKIFPGVEILATAIDNIKHGDYLKVWRGVWPYILMSLSLIWLTAAAFYRGTDRDKLFTLFGFSQISLLAISYIVMNISNFYFDLTGPVTWAIAYFSIAKIYAMANDRALQRWLAFGLRSAESSPAVMLMPILIESPEPLDDGTLKKIRRAIELLCKTPNDIEFIAGTQSGIWGLFGDMLIVSWTYANNDPSYGEAVKQEAEHIAQQLPTLLQKTGLPESTLARYQLHAGKLDSAHNLASQWRKLFAQAVIALENTVTQKD